MYNLMNKMINKRIKKISILIPVYNEEKTIIPLLQKVTELRIPGIRKEIIVINDGSTDKTKDLIKNFLKRNKNIILFSQKNNLGKGSSLKKAFIVASGDVFIIQDADLEYPPKNIYSLLKPIQKNQADVVYGSRKLNKKNKYSSFTYFIGGAFINLLIAKFINHKTLDFITGSKALRSSVAKKIGTINSKGFEFDTEVSIKIIKAGYKIEEVPIIYNPRLHKDGKKIRWYHSFRIIWTMIKSINY